MARAHGNVSRETLPLSSRLGETLTELSACSVDVSAARLTNGCLYAYVCEPTNKVVGAMHGCRLELRAGNIVELDDVHVAKRVFARFDPTMKVEVLIEDEMVGLLPTDSPEERRHILRCKQFQNL